jgi:DNA processing protein
MSRSADHQEIVELVALERAGGQLVDASAYERAAADLRRWQQDGIAVVAVGRRGYPDALARLRDAPPLLFVRGELTEADGHGVAVIGTRRPGARGLRDAAETARVLAELDCTVVSGLALGIDTAAHRAVFDAGGRTIAVLGTGLSRAYPPQNASLQARIGTSGAVISQFWPQTGPSPDGFRQRNAVMAGLTRATVIVEAHETSGTRIQARHALAYGRRLILFRPVLEHAWARELEVRPGVEVVDGADGLNAALAAPTAGRPGR